MTKKIQNNFPIYYPGSKMSFLFKKKKKSGRINQSAVESIFEMVLLFLAHGLEIQKS